MTFLVDADLPRSAADVVRRHGYDVVDVRDIGLRHAEDRVIANHAQREQQCLVTGDFDFADIRNYPPQHYAGIVVLIIPPTVTATYITQLLDSFLAQKALIAQLPGKLAIVEPGRVRLRS
jgi:predicted nuclease of predicted toxin-antitoxin system